MQCLFLTSIDTANHPANVDEVEIVISPYLTFLHSFFSTIKSTSARAYLNRSLSSWIFTFNNLKTKQNLVYKTHLQDEIKAKTK